MATYLHSEAVQLFPRKIYKYSSIQYVYIFQYFLYKVIKWSFILKLYLNTFLASCRSCLPLMNALLCAIFGTSKVLSLLNFAIKFLILSNQQNLYLCWVYDVDRAKKFLILSGKTRKHAYLAMTEGRCTKTFSIWSAFV